VNLELAGLFKHPLSKCLAFKVAFVVSYIERQEERRSIGPFTAHVAPSDAVDPLTWGCELLFHVLLSGVPEIGARFLDLAARNAVAVPPKSIIVSASNPTKTEYCGCGTPKKSNNE